MIRPTHRPWLAALALAAATVAAPLPGCKVKDGRAPASIPAGLSIPVTVDGAPAATLDTAWLASHEPDFRDGEDRRAWKLSALAGAAAEADGAVLDVRSSDGTGAALKAGPAAVPIVTFNRTGELVVKVTDPANPFPSFHGRGGNRGRAGDDERVRAVTAIHISTPPAAPMR